MPQRFERAETELIDTADAAQTGLRPVLLRPVASVRSPILENRPRVQVASAPDRYEVVLPSLRVLAGPMIWAIAPAMVLVRVGWEQALVVGAFLIVARGLVRVLGLSSVSFAQGFLPYRPDDGWPHGVQEEDEVHWDWSVPGAVGGILGGGGGALD